MFAAIALDLRHEIFVVYITFLDSPSNDLKSDVYPSCRVQIATLVANEAPNSIFMEYSDFADIFFPELASELLKYTGINNCAIKLINE